MPTRWFLATLMVAGGAGGNRIAPLERMPMVGPGVAPPRPGTEQPGVADRTGRVVRRLDAAMVVVSDDGGAGLVWELAP